MSMRNDFGFYTASIVTYLLDVCDSSFQEFGWLT